jgi:hypothetical protein
MRGYIADVKLLPVLAQETRRGAGVTWELRMRGSSRMQKDDV